VAEIRILQGVQIICGQKSEIEKFGGAVFMTKRMNQSSASQISRNEDGTTKIQVQIRRRMSWRFGQAHALRVESVGSASGFEKAWQCCH